MQVVLFKINEEKKLPVPVISLAIGMAISYYCYPSIIDLPFGQHFLLGLLFLFTGIICFLRTLMSLPEGKPQFLGKNELNKLTILITAAIVGFTFGIPIRRTVSDSLETGIIIDRIMAVSGILLEDPRTLHGGSGIGTLELRSSVGQNGIRASGRGNVTVFFPSESLSRLKEFGRGSEIYVDGSFYNGNRGLVFNATSVHIVKPAPPIETFRTGLRIALLDRFQSSQGRRHQGPPLWGGLASALLLGMREDLNVELSEGFRNSGCSHILALSGMHLAILSGALAFLLRKPLGIRAASMIGAFFIIIYVFIVGSQPSLVRAAIMYLIGTFTVWGIIKGKPLSLLCMAFIIQLFFQSESGISLSFILSYLALLGIIILGDMIRELLRGRLPQILATSFSASLGAFIFTATVVAFYFEILRPIGILAGILIAPISSLFMIFSLAALAASFLPFSVSGIFGYFFDFVLTQIYRILETSVFITGRVPGIPASNTLVVFSISFLLFILVVFLKRKDNFYRNRIASLD